MSTPNAEYMPPDAGWPHGPWAFIGDLRARADHEMIECQGILSGRWRSLAHPYWNTCVIKVPYRVKVEAP